MIIKLYVKFLILSLAFFRWRALANFVTLTDRYTADPAPFVHDGRVWIYTSHDFDQQKGWFMTDYSLMSSDDLHNWRDEGIVFDINSEFRREPPRTPKPRDPKKQTLTQTLPPPKP
jgi:hypothetical protein